MADLFDATGSGDDSDDEREMMHRESEVVRTRLHNIGFAEQIANLSEPELQAGWNSGLDEGLLTGRPAGVVLGMLSAQLQMPADLRTAVKIDVLRGVHDELKSAIDAAFDEESARSDIRSTAVEDASVSPLPLHLSRRLQTAVEVAQRTLADGGFLRSSDGHAASTRVTERNINTVDKAFVLVPGLPHRLWVPDGVATDEVVEQWLLEGTARRLGRFLTEKEDAVETVISTGQLFALHVSCVTAAPMQTRARPTEIRLFSTDAELVDDCATTGKSCIDTCANARAIKCWTFS